MKNLGIAVMGYGLLVSAGGVIGYLTAHSVASLVMGSLFGLGLMGCAGGMLLKKELAFYLSLGLTAVLSAFFIYRFLHTWKIMPAGMLAVISLAVLGALAVGLFSANKQIERL